MKSFTNLSIIIIAFFSFICLANYIDFQKEIELTKLKTIEPIHSKVGKDSVLIVFGKVENVVYDSSLKTNRIYIHLK